MEFYGSERPRITSITRLPDQQIELTIEWPLGSVALERSDDLRNWSIETYVGADEHRVVVPASGSNHYFRLQQSWWEVAFDLFDIILCYV